MHPARDISARQKPVHRTPTRTPEVVKSAVRVIEVLEFFDRNRASATVGEVAAALNFPQSSTSALLRSLVRIGYLHCDPRARSYVPTERVPLLGNWIAGPLFRGGSMLHLMDSLASRSGLAVFLARRNGDRAQYIHLADPLGVAPAGLTVGVSPALATCAVGQILLAEQTDEEVRGLMHRLNAETTVIVRTRELIARLGEIRQRGHVFMIEPSCAVLASRLPCAATATPLVLGIIGPPETLAGRAPVLVGMIREEVQAWLKPAPPKPRSFDVPAEFAAGRAKRAIRRADLSGTTLIGANR